MENYKHLMVIATIDPNTESATYHIQRSRNVADFDIGQSVTLGDLKKQIDCGVDVHIEDRQESR